MLIDRIQEILDRLDPNMIHVEAYRLKIANDINALFLEQQAKELEALQELRVAVNVAQGLDPDGDLVREAINSVVDAWTKP